MMGESRMDNLSDLWTRHTQQSDRQAREQLIVHYAWLVKYVVGRLAVRQVLPPSLEEEDLLGYGVVGMIEALDRFDPGQGVKFETFATARIRGQIIDSLRALDLLPRSVYRRAREIEAAIAQLNQALGRTPTDAEVAGQLGIGLDQYQRRLLETTCAVVSLDQPLALADGEPFTLHDSLEDDTMPLPSAQLEDREMKSLLVTAIRALPERSQQVIALYYNEGLTMKEIGEVLGVSESRVSQMHAKAMLALRSAINSSTEPNPVTYDRRGISAPLYAPGH